MRTATIRAAIAAAFTLAASAAIPMTAPQDMRFERVWEGRNVLDAALPFPDGVTFVPGAEYRAEVKNLPAGMRIVNEKGDTLAYFAAPTNVMPPFTMHVTVTGICRPAVFVTKDGKTTLDRIANLPKGFDPRHQKFMRTLSVKPDGGAGDVEARLSAGVGQADVRFVTRGREGRPYIEDGRLYFTFSVRFYAALTGVGSLDAAHPERGVRFEGVIFYDYGDGLLRNDLAPHIFFDDVADEWRGWACNFHRDKQTRGGVNAVWSKESPLHGLSVMKVKAAHLDGMGEDPCGVWDSDAKKWRMFVCRFTKKGIRGVTMESDRWEDGYKDVAGPVANDSTGTTIAWAGGTRYCLSGSSDRAYYVYSYPKLEMLGKLQMSPTPWGSAKGRPHGRGWPAFAELPDGYPHKYILLTMDRVNFPGMPKPNWTYGGLQIYVPAGASSAGIKAYSMLTHDGRRLVSHVEGTNTVFELVATNALPANLPPVREWTIYAVKSAHTDIGLHNSQYIQRHGTVRRIDEARRLIAADPDDSAPGAFRYVAEGAWFWGNYPQDRGEAEAMSVATNEIARGRLDVGVTCAGNHTHLYGFEELCRSIYTKRELEDRWGIETRTMLMTDNPGISWSIVAPYAEAGVEHVLFSPNHWNPHPSTIWKMDVNRPWSRNNPDAGGGGSRIDVRWDSAIPMLFWWEAPQSDARLLVWTCPHYGRGGEPFGIITAWNKMKPMSESEPMMARQLAKMEARYPYDVWLFADYEDDEWPSTRQADLFKKWNAKWKWPQLRTCGRLDEPFDRVKARWGDKIPTLRGEMTSGWLQHAACTPALLARKMAADRALARAETLTAVKAARDKAAYPAEDLRRAWDALIWNDEHSYGVSGYSGRRVFETWMQHRDWIERAEHIATNSLCASASLRLCVKNNPVNPVNPVKNGIAENRWYRVAVTNGVVYSIYDKELQRELLEGPANEFRYTRDNHKTWMRGDEAARALGAEVKQRVWLASDEKKIVLETAFRHARDLFNTNRYDRFGYMAFPFAVPQFRFAAQLNGPVIDPIRDQSGLTSDAFTAVRDWCAVENGEFGVALITADSCLTEFGEIHPDKTCYGGPVKSSGIYPYLFTDWLQMHNPDGDSFNFRFRYAITSYAGTWQNAHIPAFAERALNNLDEKYYGSSMSLSRYDLSVDSPAWNVQLLTLKRAEDGRGLIARFREREGRPCRVTASQHLAPDAEYTLCNVIERDVLKLDGFEFDLAPFGYATIRIDAPSLRFATKSPDDSAYAYTGLITAPRAGHGGKDGQMYVLWGAEMSPDFDHYELWRDGKFLANVTNEAPDGVAYRVARYEDLGLPTHSRHEYRIRKVWKDGRKDPLCEPFWGLTRAMGAHEANPSAGK